MYKMKQPVKKAGDARKPARGAPARVTRSASASPSPSKKKMLKKQSTMDVTKKLARTYLSKSDYIPTHRHDTRTASNSKRTTKKR